MCFSLFITVSFPLAPFQGVTLFPGSPLRAVASLVSFLEGKDVSASERQAVVVEWLSASVSSDGSCWTVESCGEGPKTLVWREDSPKFPVAQLLLGCGW